MDIGGYKYITLRKINRGRYVAWFIKAIGDTCNLTKIQSMGDLKEIEREVFNKITRGRQVDFSNSYTLFCEDLYTLFCEDLRSSKWALHTEGIIGGELV